MVKDTVGKAMDKAFTERVREHRAVMAEMGRRRVCGMYISFAMIILCLGLCGLALRACAKESRRHFYDSDTCALGCAKHGGTRDVLRSRNVCLCSDGEAFEMHAPPK